MSRDFFTNFSPAMVNGHAVARCDFKMTFRGLRGEPVPYTVLAPEHRSVGRPASPAQGSAAGAHARRGARLCTGLSDRCVPPRTSHLHSPAGGLCASGTTVVC